MSAEAAKLGVTGQCRVWTQSGGHAVQLGLGAKRNVMLKSWENRRADNGEEDVRTWLTPKQARALAVALLSAADEIDEMEAESTMLGESIHAGDAVFTLKD
jgi:hypothetical protein